MYELENSPIDIAEKGPLIENSNSSDYSVFVIALDRTAPRAGPLLQSLASEGLDFEKFSAVDGYNIKISDAIHNDEFTGLQLKEFNFLTNEAKAKSNAYFKLWHTYDIDCSSPARKLAPNPEDANFKYFCSFGWTSSAGALGLLCSSRALWKYISENNIEHALILEEDAILLTNFREQFETAIANLPANWDMLYLDITNYEHGNFRTNWDNNYVQQVNLEENRLVTSHGYMINSDTAKLLLAETKEAFTCCIDLEVDRLAREKDLIVYRAKTSLITTDHSISEIARMGVKVE